MIYVCVGFRVDTVRSVEFGRAKDLEQLLVRLKDCFERKDADFVSIRRVMTPETEQEPSQNEP